MTRQGWIDKGDAVPIVQQCTLAGVSRATIYAQQKPKLDDESDLLLCRLIDRGAWPWAMKSSPGIRSTAVGKWWCF